MSDLTTSKAANPVLLKYMSPAERESFTAKHATEQARSAELTEFLDTPAPSAPSALPSGPMRVASPNANVKPAGAVGPPIELDGGAVSWVTDAAMAAAASAPEKPSFEERALSDIGDGLLETPKAVAWGFNSALNETAKLPGEVGEWIVGQFHPGGYSGLKSELQGTTLGDMLNVQVPQLPVGSANSVTGQFIQKTAQFITGMVGAGKFAKLVGLWDDTARGVPAVVQYATAGAVSDFAVFDPHEERLADLLHNELGLDGYLVQSLMADPDDSSLVGRLKNATEGLLVGGVFDAVALGIRAIRAGRRGDTQAAIELTNQIEQLGEKAKASAGVASPDAPPARMPLQLDPTQRELAVEAFQRRFMHGEVTEPGGGVINPRTVVNAEDALASMQALSGVMQDALIRVKGDKEGVVGPVQPGDAVVTWKETTERATEVSEMLGVRPDLVMQRAHSLFEGTKQLGPMMLAMREVLTQLHTHIGNTANRIATGRSGPHTNHNAEVVEFINGIGTLADLQAMFLGMRANLGRSMNALKIKVDANSSAVLGDHKVLGKILEHHGITMSAAQVNSLAAKWSALAQNPAAIGKVLKRSAGRKLVDAVNEVFTNFILSHPVTHTVNLVSNALNSVYMPMEHFIGGAVRLKPDHMRYAMDQYVGLAGALKDASMAALKATWEGNSILDPGHGTRDTGGRYALSASSLGLGRAPDPVRWTADTLAAVINLPSRFLVSNDEWFKQLNFRAAVYASAMREARQAGKKGAELKAAVRDRLSKAFDETGMAKDDDALQYAREATFTQSLEFGIGRGLMQFASNHPLMRQLLPFIRTPTNLIRKSLRMVPGVQVLAIQSIATNLRAGGMRATRQVGELVIGASLFGWAYDLAKQGALHGSGPTNRDMASIDNAAGLLPYSVEVDGTRYQYNRLDPFGFVLTVAADLAAMEGHLSENEWDEIAETSLGALLRSFEDKTYFQSVFQKVRAWTDTTSGRDRESFSRAMADHVAAVTVPNLLKAFSDDPTVRDAYTLLDRYKRRSHLFNDELPKMFNLVGEPVQKRQTWGPDWLSPVGKSGDFDPVMAELSRLSHISNSGLRKIGPNLMGTQIDLTEFILAKTGRTGYERMNELIGGLRVGGKTLRQRLEYEINSNLYSRLPDGDTAYRGSKLDRLSAVMQQYRDLARVKLITENPDLKAALLAEKQHMRANKTPFN